nr:MAG TPA: DNA binding protein [Caudoviricetes sp.]
MKTQEFVKALATESGVTQKVARENLDAFKAVVVSELKKGGSVELQGFVSFTTHEVEEREAFNPKTKEPVTVPAHTKARATLSKTLRKI